MKFNVHNLVKWFQLNYPDAVEAMRNTSHHYSNTELNPFHLEGDVFCHTMMVVLKAAEFDNNDLLVAALLHDIGKPTTAKKNEEKRRVSFYCHEPVSCFISIDIIDKIIKDFGIELNKRTILEAIAMHTEVFKLTEEQLTDRLVNNPRLQSLLIQLSDCDHNGRFYEMGDRITQSIPFKNKTWEIKDKTVTLLVGLPCSGKSTYRNETSKLVVSRDDIVMELGNGLSYTEAWNTVDQKEVDKLLQQRKKDLIKTGKDVIIDMTNLNRKSRRKALDGFRDYNKHALVFMPSVPEIARRNEQRLGKRISESVLDRMAMSFYPPLYDEVDFIDWRF